MSLAGQLRLHVPRVWRRYTPEPVYIVERFDRHVDAVGRTRRSHIIDACQLLNKSRGFKYQAATLQTLVDIVAHCRNRASTRLRLYHWLLFNVLIANHDNHLKNLSFRVSDEGIELSPAYDLLSTAVYNTRAFADERANWPAVALAIALPGATTFGAVTRSAVLSAGEALGLARVTAERELDRMTGALPAALDELLSRIEAENVHLPEAERPYLAIEMRLAHTLKHLIAPEMIGRVARSG
jgi:serine/threonine-protein kinase HipA